MNVPERDSMRSTKPENRCYEDCLSLELLVDRMENKDAIVNGISDAIMLLDTKTYKIVDINDAFLNSYRLQLDQVVGRTCYQVTHQRSEPCPESPGHLCPLRQTVSKGDITYTEHVHKDSAGDDRHFEISAYPVKNIRGDITRIVHLGRDVTESRRVEEEFKMRLTRSEHLAAFGQIFSEITHEIKNPLTMIGGMARQLHKAIDGELNIYKLTIITEQVARLEKLLADLREYYLPRATACQPVDVKEVLEKTHLLVKDECEAKGIRDELRVEGSALIVRWDPNKLQQVLLNVIKNSIEAMEGGGHLSIQAKSSSDKVEISVRDDGHGIPKKHMGKIMQGFFTTKSHGTGLGLCISKRYVEEHLGSSFDLDSEEGKGTTVRIGLSTSEPLEMTGGVC